jgi:hypothetical protein
MCTPHHWLAGALLLARWLQGVDPRQGLPPIRAEWVAKRASDRVCTQV